MKWQHLFPSGFTVQVQKVDIAQMNNNFYGTSGTGFGRDRPCQELSGG